MNSEIEGCIEGSGVRSGRVGLRTRAWCAGILGTVIALAACAKQPTQPAVGAVSPSPAAGGEVVKAPSAPPIERPVPQATRPAREVSPLQDVFFDFDRSNIRSDGKPALNEDAGWLRVHKTAVITIEGHCDERGTSEYNMALGEHRARAAKDYLMAMGIDGTQVRTVSYGKERPFVSGHDESAWKQNRRDHFVVEKE